MRLFNQNLSAREIHAYRPDLSQIAGIRHYKLLDGKSSDVAVFEVRLGNGIRFTVIPARGFSIEELEFNGIPLSYHTGTGIVSPSYYNVGGDNWNRCFSGGMLVTCGLRQIGNPCTVDGNFFSRHGEMSNTPSEHVWTKTEWDDNELCFELGGKMRERDPFNCHMVLDRVIVASSGKHRIIVKDRVENIGFCASPFLILYHFNIGYPLVSEDSKIITSAHRILDLRHAASAWNSHLTGPSDQADPTMHQHLMTDNPDTLSMIGIVNERLKIGLALTYQASRLPVTLQYTSARAGEYFVALEPANSLYNYQDALVHNALPMLEPGEIWEQEIELSIFNDDGPDFCTSAESMIK